MGNTGDPAEGGKIRDCAAAVKVGIPSLLINRINPFEQRAT